MSRRTPPPKVHLFDYVAAKHGHVGDALEFIQYRLAFVEWSLKAAGHATDDADDQIAFFQFADVISDVREAAERIKDDRNQLLDTIGEDGEPRREEANRV